MSPLCCLKGIAEITRAYSITDNKAGNRILFEFLGVNTLSEIVCQDRNGKFCPVFCPLVCSRMDDCKSRI